jgi:hypothetical protein
MAFLVLLAGLALGLALVFVFDVLIAWLVWLIAPLTGIAQLDALSFWQTFWTVVVVSLVVRTSAVNLGD